MIIASCQISDATLPGKTRTVVAQTPHTSKRERELLQGINALFRSHEIPLEKLQKIELSKSGELSAEYFSGTTLIFDDLTDAEKELIAKIITAFQEFLSPSKQTIQLTQLSITHTHQTVFDRDALIRSEKRFNQLNVEVKNLMQTIEAAEKNHTKLLLNKLTQLYAAVDRTQTPEELKRLKKAYDAFSLAQKGEFDTTTTRHVDKLERLLFALTQEYNNLVDAMEQEKTKSPPNAAFLKLCETKKAHMYEKIHFCNHSLSQKSLTINPFTVQKSHVMDFAAVVEKKWHLRQQQETLQACLKSLRPTAPKAAKNKLERELKKLSKTLSHAPTTTAMQAIRAQIIQHIDTPPDLSDPAAVVSQKKQLHCFAATKAAYRFQKPTFKWAKDYRSLALTTPANWTTIRKTFIKQSKSHHMYVMCTMHDPLNIAKNKGIPAWLRGVAPYNKKVANFMKVTSYVLAADGTRQYTYTSFRGAQLPTVKAAKEMLTTLLASGVPQELHINALLTPITFGRPDRKLLVKSKKNITTALDQLIAEHRANIPYCEALRHLKQHLSVSNFGVNRSSGDLKKKNISLKWLTLGWHTSIKDYSNAASQTLNRSIRSALKFDPHPLITPTRSLSDYPPQELDRLGAIVQVGQEMEAIWATNSFASAKVGNNPFKLPALWKTMDALLGTCCYMHCKSGKDRTGKVESHAQAYLDEITMNIIEQKQRLNKKVTTLSHYLSPQQRAEWELASPYLTAACFTPKEIETLFNAFHSKPIPLQTLIQAKVEEKYQNARVALGVDAWEHQFMEPKTVTAVSKVKSGTSGISTNLPKRNIESCQAAASVFPQLAASTIFSDALSWKGTKALREILTQNPYRYQRLLDAYQKRQLEAANIRLSQFAALDATQMNTGKPGFKVKGGSPLSRASAGFDRDYVLLKIFQFLETPQAQPYAEFQQDFIDLVGLDEFDPITQAEFLQRFDAATTLKEHLKTIKAIEVAKTGLLSPQTKVQS